MLRKKDEIQGLLPGKEKTLNRLLFYRTFMLFRESKKPVANGH
jgi:hypothetical protein